MESQSTQPQPQPLQSAPVSNGQLVPDQQVSFQQSTSPEPVLPPTPKRNTKIYLFILIPILTLLVVGVVVFVLMKRNQNQTDQSSLETVNNLVATPLASASSSASPASDSDNCTPLSFGLKKSTAVDALFLQETEKRGYEGIVRKSTQDGKTSFDIVTNQLPDSGAPYNVWIAYPDANGRICDGVSLGPMAKDPTTGIWQISFDDSDYKDDANVVLITSGNLDTQDGNLDSMDDPHVILRGFFAQTANVDEAK
jgi:hypothetical protein